MPTATTIARSAPSTTAPTTPMRPSDTVVAGLAPSARKTSRSSAPARSWRLINWIAISERRERCDRAEHAQRDRFGFDGALCFRDFRRREGAATAARPLLREGTGDLALHGGHVAGTPVDGDRRLRDECAARDERPHQRGSEEDPAVAERVDVVLDDLGVEGDDPDEP